MTCIREHWSQGCSGGPSSGTTFAWVPPPHYLEEGVLGGRQTPDQCAQWVPDAAQNVSAMQAHNALSKKCCLRGSVEIRILLAFYQSAFVAITSGGLRNRPVTWQLLVKRREFIECTEVTRTGHTIHQKNVMFRSFPLVLLFCLCAACTRRYGPRKLQPASCINREPGSSTGSQPRDQPRLQNIVLSIPNAVIIYTL